MDSINYALDIETSTIIDDVRRCWKNFQRQDLIRLSDSFEEILIKKRIDEVRYDRTTNSKDIHIYLDDIIPNEAKRILNENECPIRNIFFAPSRIRDLIIVLSAEVPIKLSKEDIYFNIFFSFKLATVEPQKLELFLNHQLCNSFNDNIGDFRRFLQINLSDNRSILGERKSAISGLIKEIYPQGSDIADAAGQSLNFVSSTLLTAKNDHKLDEIFFHAAIPAFKEFEERLFEDKYIIETYKWVKSLEECVAFIMTLVNNKYIRKTLKFTQKNTDFSKIVKPFFEQRYDVKFTKQMQPSCRNSEKIKVLMHSFNYISKLS